MLELEQVPVEVAAALLAFECVVMGLGTAGEMHAAAFCEAEEVACIKQQEWKEEVSEEQDDAKLPSGVFVCKRESM